MKKYVASLLVVLMLILSFGAVSFAEEESYQIYVNGKKLESDYPPIVENYAIYVPLWSVLGAADYSAIYSRDIFRINTNDGVVLVRPDHNALFKYPFATGNLDESSYNLKLKYDFYRQDYYPITRNWVIYAPLTLLQDYLGMSVAWGDNKRIDITAKSTYKTSLSKFYKDAVGALKKVSFSMSTEKDFINTIDNSVTAGAEELRRFAAIEEWISKQNTYWLDARFANYEGHDHTEEVVVVGYSGNKITFSNSKGEFTKEFGSLQEAQDGLFTSNPIAGLSAKAQAAVKARQVYVGMSRSEAVLSWGKPDDMNKWTSGLGTTEQWVYRSGSLFNAQYIYFTNGVLTSIQN
ncbi:hypothetical protein [Paenibacillus whitsoniae]|uniref:Copper amine oxidase N-terminal domain-containing protein n=1 Tax=Paenibacillus whitsoniae TaxID=2496558 RepID=A0A430J8U8_9BACL|nr:hypothetical protein [Paenibacillus whitsoniae]RTE06771.1 hypothetical protein EJQ19_22490 [Paenibacillus whitsoniae]